MSEALLSVRGLAAGYGATEVLRGIDLEVAAGEIVAVLGSNGAGKSTLNRTISGVLRATQGSIRFAGSAIEREKPATIVARGLIHVPEGRCVFPNLTIMENLDLGSYRRGRTRRKENREQVFAIFPRLAERPRVDGRAEIAHSRRALARPLAAARRGAVCADAAHQ